MKGHASPESSSSQKHPQETQMTIEVINLQAASHTLQEYPSQTGEQVDAAAQPMDTKMSKEQMCNQKSLQLKEQTEEDSESQDSIASTEMSVKEKHDKHLIVPRLKNKETEKKEDPSKIKGHKLKMLKKFSEVATRGGHQMS